jgi:hypothetical protein
MAAERDRGGLALMGNRKRLAAKLLRSLLAEHLSAERNQPSSHGVKNTSCTTWTITLPASEPRPTPGIARWKFKKDPVKNEPLHAIQDHRNNRLLLALLSPGDW